MRGRDVDGRNETEARVFQASRAITSTELGGTSKERELD